MNSKTLKFLLKINDLQKTNRYGKYPEFIESTSEHTFKLILIVDYFYRELKLDLDYEKCIRLAIYHDFSEMDLDIDIDAYESSKIETANSKKISESMKIEEISKKYYSEIKFLFDEYEQKKSEEAKFINACDKLEACIHVLNVDYKIMNHEFFATYSDNAIINFPKLLPIYKQVKKIMKKKYKNFGYKWETEYEKIFESS